MRRLKVLGVVLAVCLVAAACGSGSGATNSTAPPTNSSGVGGSVTLSNESGAYWTCQFNPFNGSVTDEAAGFIYESLMFVNVLQDDKTTPWLATGYSWSNAGRTLTFTIRSGVKWSDGTPFSAKDVLFTFQLLKKNPALDLNSIWAVLNSVALKGSNQIVLNFKTPAATYFYYVADQLPIVPEHIWASISKPVTYTDSHPIGTGPYLVHDCTGENIEYQRNPDYWQPGLPKIETVNYPAFTQNTAANEDLAFGKAQWGGQYIADIQGYYLSKNTTDYHDWFPPLQNVTLFPNLTDKLLSLPVREAISLGIDRAKVSELGESGYEPPANQDGIVQPTFSSWNDSAYSSEYPYDPSKAETILENAGYKKVNGVFQSPSGQPLSFSVVNIGDYPDWVADLTIITDELAQIGIQLKVDELSSTTYDSDVYNGDFQLAYDAETGGPTPYFELRQWLYGPNSAPIGQTASTNWERFDASTAGAESTTVDNLFNSYAATTSLATQESITDQLEHVMVSQVPVIPVVESVDWYEYDTANLSGWPTQQNPYAQPSPYVVPDLEVVLLHLRWTK
jgi:peptide/nickel transport system substrate-binding protein